MIVGPPMTKQSTEVIDWAVDFKHELATGQYLATATFLAVLEADNTDVTTDLTFTALSIVGTSVVTQLIEGGVPGQTYMLELQAVDNSGRVFEAERRMVVTDIITKPVL
jgi:hypothetical protein